MLEQFHVREEDAVRVQEAPLRATVAAIFEKMGVPAGDAELAADVLVTADLRGVESHGVSNMLRTYVAAYNRGEINPHPDWRVVRETPATANVDSDRGLGIIVAPKAMEIAIEKAKATGLGMVTISNGRHMGMASYHAMLALKHDMIGISMTACPPSVLPTFGAETRVGTNPIAMATPAREEPPFVYDAATSVVAGNKIGLARRVGAKIPSGWLGDEQGSPFMKPEVDRFKELMDDFLRTLRETPPAPGHERVFYPGLPEWEAERDRRANGIPLHKEVVQWFRDISSELGIAHTLHQGA